MPNWFVNLCSPFVGIPLPIFVIATLVGLIPANFVHVNTGLAIHSVTSLNGTLDWKVLTFQVLLGMMALIPTFFAKKNHPAIGNKKLE